MSSAEAADEPGRDDPDARLVLRAQDGDSDAFESLVDRYQGPLFRTAYMMLGDRQDSEDTVQEALLLSWRRLHLVEDPSAFRPWLFTICTRRSTDVLRKRARRATDPCEDEGLERLGGTGQPGAGRGEAGALMPGGSADPAEASEINALMEALTGILAGIEHQQRACWILREIEDMSYREIAHILDTSETTVRGRLARARQHVMRRMEEWR